MEPDIRDDRDVLQDDSPLCSMHIPELPEKYEAEEDGNQVVRKGIGE
jgi:hypothetical protein